MAFKPEISIVITEKGTARKYSAETKKAQKSTDNLVKSAKKLAVAYIGIQSLRIAKDMALAAASADRNKKALDGLVGSAREAAKWTMEIQRATRGTVSAVDAVAAAARFASMGMADNAESAAKLAKIAVTLGAAFGKEATPAIEEFSLLLANQSILRLDTFGISGAKVRERIKEQQIETPGLSRETAFMTAVMEEGEKKLITLDGVLETDAASFDRLGAAIKDRVTQAFAALNVVLGPTADLIAGVLEGNRDTIQQMLAAELALLESQKLRLTIIKQAAQLTGDADEAASAARFLKSLSLQIPKLELKLKTLKAIDAALLDTASSTDSLSMAIPDLADAIALTERNMRRLRLEGRNLNDIQKEEIRLTSLSIRGFLSKAIAASIAAHAGAGLAGLIAGTAAAIGFERLFDRFVPSFAHGGEFVTSGPQLIMVGDNRSGRERVQITPSEQGMNRNITININGVVTEHFVREDLLPVLNRVR